MKDIHHLEGVTATSHMLPNSSHQAPIGSALWEKFAQKGRLSPTTPLTGGLWMAKPEWQPHRRLQVAGDEGKEWGDPIHLNACSRRKLNLRYAKLCGRHKIEEEISKCGYKWERSKTYFSSSPLCNLLANWHIITQKDRNETVTVAFTLLAESNFAFQSSSSWQGWGHLGCQVYPGVGIKMIKSSHPVYILG